MKFDENCLNLIRDLANAKAPSGFEEETLEVVRKYVGDKYLIEEDKFRNLYLYRKKNTGDKPLVALDAHSDEVGFMVHSIKPNGTIRVVTLGGWTISTLPAAKVKVRNAEGKWISGVFVSKPKHFVKAEDNKTQPTIADMAIDVGATSDKEAKERFKIRIGEPVVPAAEFEYDKENDLMFGKAFDCRVGCASLIETMRRIDDLDLDVDVVGVLSSQEEVGDRGVKLSANHVKADIAICFEGCPADDTFTESYAIQTALRKGPMFRHMDKSAINHHRLQRFILDLAEEKGMDAQESVREGGGNDAAIYQTTLEGAPAATAGIPVRYIHSMNCIATYEDFEKTTALVVEILKALNKEVIDKL